MPNIEAKFLSRIQRTDNVFSFRFEPAEKVNFLPGQFSQVIFDRQDPGNKTLNKCLSFSCAPGKNFFEVTKKISQSDFSRNLMDLQPGARVLFKPPMGNCVFNPRVKNPGFIIGGIGITPVISILEYIVEQRVAAQVNLLYSNRTSSDIAFRTELENFSRARPDIKIFHILTDCQPDDKSYAAGCINGEFIKTCMPDFAERVIFIFGPPAMVKSVEGICLSLGCPKDKIKVENFVGY